jgi:DNA-binding LacI/PurR family transcriptional regulator
VGLGHRRIGFLAYAANELSRHREQGFRDAMAEAGLPVSPEWCDTGVALGDRATHAAARRILALPQRPTAIACASDRIAARVIQAASAAGLCLPRDLSIVGYNGDPWAQLTVPPLTTVAQPRLEVGERAAQAVLAPSDGDGGFTRVVLEATLLLRASTAPPVESVTPQPSG